MSEANDKLMKARTAERSDKARSELGDIAANSDSHNNELDIV